MLYHPCAPEELVDQLRKIVVGCLRNQSKIFLDKHVCFYSYLPLLLRKHVIAPSTRFTSKERPLTLVAWLCRQDKKCFPLIDVTPYSIHLLLRLTMATVNQKEVRQ